MPSLKSLQPARLSRDRSFLIKASLALSIASIPVAFVVSLISPSKPNPKEEMAALQKIINDDTEGFIPKTFEDWVFFLRTGITIANSGSLRDCRSIEPELEGDAREPIEPEGLVEI